MKKPKLHWHNAMGGGFWIRVPILMHEQGRKGEYEIHIDQRPTYCDRGDWIIRVEGYNDIDAADLFPRYFFGSADEVKAQMEAFLNRRKSYRDAKAKAA